MSTNDTDPLVKRSKRRDDCSCPWSQASWNLFFKVSALIIALAGLITVAIAAAISGQGDSVLRIAVVATPEQVYPSGSGEAGALLDGLLIMNSAENFISYDFFYYNISTIESLVIRGPRAAGQRQGPLLFSLCGVPNLVNVCDPFTVPGQIEGGEQHQLEPGSLDARPVIADIRTNPTRYYLEVLTSDHSSEPGALRFDFTGSV